MTFQFLTSQLYLRPFVVHSAVITIEMKIDLFVLQ